MTLSLIDEEQAEKMICPMISAPEKEFYCITHQCMMWQRSFTDQERGIKVPSTYTHYGHCRLWTS